MNTKFQGKAKNPTRSGSPVICNNLFRHRAIRQIEADETHHESQLRDSNFNHDFSRVPISANSQAAAVAPLFSPRVPGPIQAKLVVNQPGDGYEREADRVADAVMRMPEPHAVSSSKLTIQGNCPTCHEKKLRWQPIKEEVLLQTKISGQNAEITPDLESRINAIRSGGQPLAESERAFFEPRFGRDFSQVRLHTDMRAAELAKGVNARAFTFGSNVVFGEGQYASGIDTRGRLLLAHELAHVIQQTNNQSIRENSRSIPIKLCKPNNLPNKYFLQRRIMIGNGAEHEISDIERNQVFMRTMTRGRRFASIYDHPDLAQNIVDDLSQAYTIFHFINLDELRSEVAKRTEASAAMTASQEGGSEWPAFGYPHRGAVLNYGPRVNLAAMDYWEPRVPDICHGPHRGGLEYCERTSARPHPRDPSGNYEFRPTPAGRRNGYVALMSLFTRQPGDRRRFRTLIHCDYLTTLIHYRSVASSLGVQEFNRLVQTPRSGRRDDPAQPDNYLIPLRLQFNGHLDIGNVIYRGRREIPNIVQERRHLQYADIAHRNDFVIGDHVKFYNHIFYDALQDIAGRSGVWRLENAILINRSDGDDLFQGHGTRPLTEQGMKRELKNRFNDIIPFAIRRLRRDFDGVHRRPEFTRILRRNGSRYYLHGPGVVQAYSHSISLRRGIDWPIQRINNLNEIPGLYMPEFYSISYGRPIYELGTARYTRVRRPVESLPGP